MRNWKRGERVIAELFGCERIPITGRHRGKAFADLVSNWLSVEVKTRKQLPKLLADAIDSAEYGAEYACRQDGRRRLPIVVLHADHQDYANSLLVIRVRAADEWFGVLEREEDSDEGTAIRQ